MQVRHGQRGMVTVELAFALLALAVFSVGALGVVAGLYQQGQLQVTANEVARQEARGDAVAAQRAAQDAPPGARVTSRREAGAVVVEASRATQVGPVPVTLQARAVVLEER